MTAVQLEKEVPTLMTKEEFFAKLDRAEEQVQRGEYVSFDSVEELDRYIRGQLPELCSRDGIKSLLFNPLKKRRCLWAEEKDIYKKRTYIG